MTTELRMYSTVAGELPSLVRNQVPKCFVEYEQYLEVQNFIKDAVSIPFEQFYESLAQGSEGEIGIYAANLLYKAGYRLIK